MLGNTWHFLTAPGRFDFKQGLPNSQDVLNGTAKFTLWRRPLLNRVQHCRVPHYIPSFPTKNQPVSQPQGPGTGRRSNHESGAGVATQRLSFRVSGSRVEGLGFIELGLGYPPALARPRLAR